MWCVKRASTLYFIINPNVLYHSVIYKVHMYKISTHALHKTCPNNIFYHTCPTLCCYPENVDETFTSKLRTKKIQPVQCVKHAQTPHVVSYNNTSVICTLQLPKMSSFDVWSALRSRQMSRTNPAATS